MKTKKEQILEAALKLFAEKGFYEARVEEIAAAAGVGKGTLYEYFTGKEALFEEMFKSGLRTYFCRFEDHLKEARTCRELFYQIMLLHLEFIQSNRSLAKLLWETQGGVVQNLRDWFQKMENKKLKTLMGTLKEGMERGEFRAADPEIAARTFMGILGAMCAPLILTERELDAAEITKKALSIYFRGIAVG